MTITMRTSLNGKQRRYLRALAHDKKPVVQLGKEGLTPTVVAAIDSALETHELIKVKAGNSFDEDLDEVAARIEQETRSSLCNVVGHTLVLYRRRTKNPKIVLPKLSKTKKPAPDTDE